MESSHTLSDSSQALSGRVIAITGAGRGIGREYALRFASHGAKVVVNDFGGARDGSQAASDPASEVVEEIRAAGGEGIPHTGDVSDWDVAETLVQTAVEGFGKLDVLVNNAGILRDRTIVNVTAEEWDAVIRVHLRGTAGPSHHAAAYWRARSKAGDDVNARLINTSSPSGLYGRPGQCNYGAAKAGIAAFTIIAAQELANYGVTANAIAPVALTRMTDDIMTPEQAQTHRPESIAPFVAWLASAGTREITGNVFGVGGAEVYVAQRWQRTTPIKYDLDAGFDWFDEAIPQLLESSPS